MYDYIYGLSIQNICYYKYFITKYKIVGKQ
jgi:hypothetical protein